MSLNVFDGNPACNPYNLYYPSISLKNPNFSIKNNNNNEVNKYQMNFTYKNSTKLNSKSTTNFFSPAETHRKNASSNNVHKKPDNRVLNKIDKLYCDLKEKEKKLENIIEPFLSRNRVRIKKENIYLGQMKNLKNSVDKKEQEKDASFVKINIYNSINNDEKDLSPNVYDIFSNKFILNNLNEHNIIRSGVNQKIILLPNTEKNFGFLSSKGTSSNKTKFKRYNSNSRGKFFNKEIKFGNKNNKNQIPHLDTNCSNSINNFNNNKNLITSNYININNFFHNQTSNHNKNCNSNQSNFNSSLTNGKVKINSINTEEFGPAENANQNHYSNNKNMNNYSSNLNLNFESKKRIEKQDELKYLNLPKRRNLSDIPSSTRKCKLNKVSNEQEHENTGQEINNSEEQGNPEASKEERKISEKIESCNSAAEESDDNHSYENDLDNNKNDTISSFENALEEKKNLDRNKKEIRQKLRSKQNQNISVSIYIENSTIKNKDDLLNSSKSPNKKYNKKYIDKNTYENSDMVKKQNFSSCTNFYSIKTNIGDERAKEKLNTRHHFYSNKTATNNLKECSPPSEIGKKTSNFGSNINWRSKSQSKINPFEHLNQEIENIYDIRIDAKYDKAFDSKVAKIDEELKENKYFDNIKFNYMVMNFQRFKDFIQKPPVIIKPAKINPVPQQIFNNELKVSILKKLKNAMLKKEIQKKNLY